MFCACGGVLPYRPHGEGVAAAPRRARRDRLSGRPAWVVLVPVLVLVHTSHQRHGPTHQHENPGAVADAQPLRALSAAAGAQLQRGRLEARTPARPD